MQSPLDQATREVAQQRHNLSQTLDQLDDRLTAWADRIRERAGAPERFIRRNPWMAVAAVVTLGFVIGVRIEPPGARPRKIEPETPPQDQAPRARPA